MSKAYFDIRIDNVDAGRIEMLMYDHSVPKTCKNFMSLCIGTEGVSYEGSRFHYAKKDFSVRGGLIPVDDGRSGISIYGQTFPDENFVHKHTAAYILSMANAGVPGTNSSAFSIMLGMAPMLDGKQVVFGAVSDGFDVVRKIEALGTPAGVLTADVVIYKCGAV